MRKAVHSFDARFTRYIQSWPKWLKTPMLAITNTGQPLTVLLFAAGLFVWAMWERDTLMAEASIVVVVTVIISSLLKTILRRARPQTDYVASMIFKTFSFPSGHAAAATVGFGFLAYLAFMLLSSPVGVIFCVLIIIYALLIGISRIYLGAHYPSDVIGGILLGGVGLAVILLLVRPLG